jgi:two-component system, LuxR family, sensor kinase FixL
MTDLDQGELLAQFARDGIQRSRRGAAIFCAFTAALLLLSAAYSRFSEPAIFAELLRIRVLALSGVAAIAWLLATPFGARRPRELAVALMCTISICIQALAQDTGGQLSPQYDRLNLVVLGAAILMSWNAAWSALACGAVIGTYVAGASLVGGIASAQFPASLGRLLVTSIVTVGANAVRERYRWRELWHVYALDAARRRAEAEIQRLNADLEQRVLDRTAALRASEERFRAMFEAAPLGVVTIDPAGRLLQSNRAFAAMLGYDAPELGDRPLETLLAEPDRPRAAAHLTALRDGQRAALAMDASCVRRDGSVVVTHGALAAIRDEGERFLCALGIFEDVTDRRQAEDLAREHQERLTQVLRVTTMGGMVAELAHELNQPLGAIVNFANGTSARLRQSRADPEIADAVARIATEGMRAAEIIRRVREFVRPGGVPTERVDLNALVRDAVRLLESDAQRQHIPVRLGLDPGLPSIRVDRIHVEQVLLNLLRNALDAMRAAPAADHELSVLTVAGGGDGVEVRVRDTGTGVPSEAGERIFDAFFTTKPGGLGMGLSISRSIVEAYGGRLWASSNPDRGMTFAFSLPDGGDPPERHPAPA